MLIIGRITKNAVVNQLKNERQVVNFSVAINDYYKPRDGEGIKLTTYFNCSYWISSKIAERLTKGALVELFGRVSINTYTDLKGEAKGSLNFHANNIKIHSTSNSSAVVDKNGSLQPAGASALTEPVEVLPF